MSQSSAKSERITAIISTVVAIAILAAGVTAHQSNTATQDELTLLESDLRFQLDRAFRHQPKQRAERVAQLETALKAWRKSPQSSEDRALLSEWLLEATVRSMPGTTEPLPIAPEFGSSKPETVEALSEPVEALGKEEPVEPTPVPDVPQVQTAPASDPFSDDLAIPEDELLQVSTSEPIAKPLAVSVGQTDPVELAPATQQDKKPIKINTTELTARIAGYHLGLDRVETALLTGETSKLDFLAQQIQQLDDLTRDFGFVNLYYEALSERERRNLRAPRSMEATLAELERLLRRIEDGQSGDFLSSIDTTTVQQIQRLRRQLDAIEDRAE